MIYEYRCTECQKVYEAFSNYKEEKEKKCIFCGNISKRIISKSNFKMTFRGEYYYQNKQKD